ncbi:MAG: hypothetical protein AAGA93_26855 [Actinomycetota bacterium]
MSNRLPPISAERAVRLAPGDGIVVHRTPLTVVVTAHGDVDRVAAGIAAAVADLIDRGDLSFGPVAAGLQQFVIEYQPNGVAAVLDITPDPIAFLFDQAGAVSNGATHRASGRAGWTTVFIEGESVSLIVGTGPEQAVVDWSRLWAGVAPGQGAQVELTRSHDPEAVVEEPAPQPVAHDAPGEPAGYPPAGTPGSGHAAPDHTASDAHGVSPAAGAAAAGVAGAAAGAAAGAGAARLASDDFTESPPTAAAGEIDQAELRRSIGERAEPDVAGFMDADGAGTPLGDARTGPIEAEPIPALDDGAPAAGQLLDAFAEPIVDVGDPTAGAVEAPTSSADAVAESAGFAVNGLAGEVVDDGQSIADADDHAHQREPEEPTPTDSAADPATAWIATTGDAGGDSAGGPVDASVQPSEVIVGHADAAVQGWAGADGLDPSTEQPTGDTTETAETVETTGEPADAVDEWTGRTVDAAGEGAGEDIEAIADQAGASEAIVGEVAADEVIDPGADGAPVADASTGDAPLSGAPDAEGNRVDALDDRRHEEWVHDQPTSDGPDGFGQNATPPRPEADLATAAASGHDDPDPDHGETSVAADAGPDDEQATAVLGPYSSLRSPSTANPIEAASHQFDVPPGPPADDVGWPADDAGDLDEPSGVTDLHDVVADAAPDGHEAPTGDGAGTTTDDGASSATDDRPIDHSAIDHSAIDHSAIDHSAIDHSAIDHRAIDHRAIDDRAIEPTITDGPPPMPLGDLPTGFTDDDALPPLSMTPSTAAVPSSPPLDENVPPAVDVPPSIGGAALDEASAPLATDAAEAESTDEPTVPVDEPSFESVTANWTPEQLAAGGPVDATTPGPGSEPVAMPPDPVAPGPGAAGGEDGTASVWDQSVDGIDPLPALQQHQQGPAPDDGDDPATSGRRSLRSGLAAFINQHWQRPEPENGSEHGNGGPVSTQPVGTDWASDQPGAAPSAAGASYADAPPPPGPTSQPLPDPVAPISGPPPVPADPAAGGQAPVPNELASAAPPPMPGDLASTDQPPMPGDVAPLATQPPMPGDPASLGQPSTTEDRLPDVGQPPMPDHAASPWAHQQPMPGDVASTDQPPMPGDLASTDQPPMPGDLASTDQPPMPGDLASTDQPPMPGDLASLSRPPTPDDPRPDAGQPPMPDDAAPWANQPPMPGDDLRHLPPPESAPIAGPPPLPDATPSAEQPPMPPGPIGSEPPPPDRLSFADPSANGEPLPPAGQPPMPSDDLRRLPPPQAEPIAGPPPMPDQEPPSPDGAE